MDGGLTDDQLALKALAHSLGESPRFAPSVADVCELLQRASALIRERGYCPVGLGCDSAGVLDRAPFVKLSILGAIRECATGPKATHWHAERYMRRLLNTDSLGHPPILTQAQALAKLERAIKILKPSLPRTARGWRVSPGRRG